MNSLRDSGLLRWDAAKVAYINQSEETRMWLTDGESPP